MFGILWFLFITFAISSSLVWLLDHDGSVVITWFGYQVQTDAVTAILLAIFFTLLVFAISYLLARILAIRFPNILKFFFRKKYLKSLEKIVHRHHQAFDVMSQLLLALEVKDKKSAVILQKKFSHLIKNSALNNFFLGKISFDSQDFSRSAEFFSKYEENKHAKILVLKSKLQLALKNQDEVSAIAYAKQILSARPDNFDIAKILFALYKKCGLWQDAKGLIAEYGSDKFKDELQKRDIAVINSALALEAYQQKKFTLAIKHVKIALKAENNFLPATEILLKSWIKCGFAFRAKWAIKNLWRENPHLILAEIFDLLNRKTPAKTRIQLMKKLVESNSESSVAKALGKLAIGLVAFRAGEYQTAKDFANLSLSQEKNYRAYKLLAFVERALGNKEEFSKNMLRLKMLEHDDHYACNSCSHVFAKWSAKCNQCGSYDSLEWNN